MCSKQNHKTFLNNSHKCGPLAVISGPGTDAISLLILLLFFFFCLEDKREDYQNCSVLYCAPQLYTVINTHIWTVLTGVWSDKRTWNCHSSGSDCCL